MPVATLSPRPQLNWPTRRNAGDGAKWLRANQVAHDANKTRPLACDFSRKHIWIVFCGKNERQCLRSENFLAHCVNECFCPISLVCMPDCTVVACSTHMGEVAQSNRAIGAWPVTAALFWLSRCRYQKPVCRDIVNSIFSTSGR